MTLKNNRILKVTTALICGSAVSMWAADAAHGSGYGADKHHGVHLSTPLQTQNPMPKKKVKTAYVFQDIPSRRSTRIKTS